ncbi:outer membrane lipoprotein carrier protein LolA [Aliihoeflea sp. 2WW]|jgi:outer membrane lipoprotein-sorting protein|uniref:outer-membrane lipoprotein carrier protein LolA n=1 Tax=Aliihoeflea sp. 2WW TaxID=1381123 RepID=UPI0004636F00|nr:outer membrane lipoprotein carrier protein LolA [Aliihoeflea sp. 2WW]
MAKSSSKTRRGVLALGMGAALLAASGILPAGKAMAQPAEAQQIADHFSSVKTMMGDFVQFGPSGEQTGGKFFIERPGKVRFNYENPSTFKVTADGTSVVLENARMNTADLYSLSSTPLKLLLDERIDLSGNKVQDVRQEADATTITLADRSVFGNSTITMMFDPQNYELKQWTIRDAQGKDTTVMIYNVQSGVTFDRSVFAINYDRINEMVSPNR